MKEFFAHQSIRHQQREMVQLVTQACQESGNVLIHAPTGSGKTAGSLSPAIAYALEHDKVVLFVTARHTQHAMAIKTIEALRKRTGKQIGVVSLIAKRQMCLVGNVPELTSSEFAHYCKQARESGQCKFYTNTRKPDATLTSQATAVVEHLSGSVADTHLLIEKGRQCTMCPYELAGALAADATVIIGDYSHVFHPTISRSLLGRLRRDMGDVIVIVDEAHNVPDRLRGMASHQLSTHMLRQGHREAGEYQQTVIQSVLRELEAAFEQYNDEPEYSQEHSKTTNNTHHPSDIEMWHNNQKLIQRSEFMQLIEQQYPYDQLIEELTKAGEMVRATKHRSWMLSIAQFLEQWKQPDNGFTRILTRTNTAHTSRIVLSLECIDPSVMSGPIIQGAHSVIMMSGTLLPLEMYRDIMGFPRSNTTLKALSSHFPSHHALHWIIPSVTTRWSQRNDEQYTLIAQHLDAVFERVKVNTAVYFPSYALRDSILKHLQTTRPLHIEQSTMTKEHKDALLFQLRNSKRAIMLGVAQGSFGEGIDLPGKQLECVIIVGVPLDPVTLLVKQRIEYFQKKYGKGWYYGYMYPAFNRTLQNAGRCIRNETDKGLIVYMDQRYASPAYQCCFPPDFRMVISTNLAVGSAFFEH